MELSQGKQVREISGERGGETAMEQQRGEQVSEQWGLHPTKRKNLVIESGLV